LDFASLQLNTCEEIDLLREFLKVSVHHPVYERHTPAFIKMTIRGFYLVGLSKDVYHQDIHIDQYHDFEALQVAVAEQYNIIQPASEQRPGHFSQSAHTYHPLRYWTARRKRE
jgi:hypothetical protein